MGVGGYMDDVQELNFNFQYWKVDKTGAWRDLYAEDNIARRFQTLRIGPLSVLSFFSVLLPGNTVNNAVIGVIFIQLFPMM